MPETPVAKPPKWSSRRPRPNSPRPRRRLKARTGTADGCARQHHSARRLRQPGAGRTGLDRTIISLPVHRQHGQADRAVPRRASGSALAQLRRRPKRSKPARRSRPPARIASWRSRCRPAIYGPEGLELTRDERSFLQGRRPGRLHPVPPELRSIREQLQRLTDSLRDLTGSSQLADPDRSGRWHASPACGPPLGRHFPPAERFATCTGRRRRRRSRRCARTRARSG